MINFNGQLLDKDSPLFKEHNRAFRYGDCLFETIRCFGEKIFFWEDHYLRLMASMRILRMEIPMKFTMEYLAEEIGKVITKNDLSKSPCRVRLAVFRNDGGLYTPENNDTSYVISALAIEHPFFVVEDSDYRVDLFKEHYLNTGLIATLKTNNRIINVVGSVYAGESESDNLVLLNHNKMVVETLSGNIFLVKDKSIHTPPLSDGCINGIIRKKILEILKKDETYELEERSISPFELQKADELFTTNAISGIRSITHYRRKEYRNEVARYLVAKLNALARLS